MRTTMHSARGPRTGGAFGTFHNDRNGIGKARNIDSERTIYNYEWMYTDELDNSSNISYTFDSSELKFYKDNFTPVLEDINRRNERYRMYKRVCDMERWRRQRNHAPEEVILQVGNVRQHPPLETFKKIALRYVEYLNQWTNDHNKPYTILNYALHQDEVGAPHVHMRRVWHYYNEEKNRLEPGQEKALEMAGVPLPYPEKEEGRYNNRKMTFDKEMRDVWNSYCRDEGIIIENEPLPKREVGMDLQERIIRYERERKQMMDELKNEKNELKLLRDKLEQREKELEEKDKELDKQQEELDKKSEELKRKDDYINYKINDLKQIKKENTTSLHISDNSLEWERFNKKLDKTFPTVIHSGETPLAYAKRNIEEQREMFNDFYETVGKSEMFNRIKQENSFEYAVSTLKKENKVLKVLIDGHRAQDLIDKYKLKNFDELNTYAQGEHTYNYYVKDKMKPGVSISHIVVPLTTKERDDLQFYLEKQKTKYEGDDIYESLYELAEDKGIKTRIEKKHDKLYEKEDMEDYEDAIQNEYGYKDVTDEHEECEHKRYLQVSTYLFDKIKRNSFEEYDNNLYEKTKRRAETLKPGQLKKDAEYATNILLKINMDEKVYIDEYDFMNEYFEEENGVAGKIYDELYEESLLDIIYEDTNEDIIANNMFFTLIDEEKDRREGREDIYDYEDEYEDENEYENSNKDSNDRDFSR